MNNKIELSQTELENIIENYYKENFNIDCYFRFIYVFYQYKGPIHSIYSYREQRWYKQEDIVSDWKAIPCIIDKNINLEEFNTRIDIKEIVKPKNLNSIINEKLEKSTKRISYKDINEIMNDMGYKDLKFKFYPSKIYYNVIEYNANVNEIKKDKFYLRKIIKKKEIV